MTQDEIIEMARNVGYPLAEYEGKPYVPPMLTILLKTAIETEREACAKVVEASPSYDWHKFACEAAYAIRARGQA